MIICISYQLNLVLDSTKLKSEQQFYNSKMGHQTSAIARIHQISAKFTLVKQSPDEKFYLDRSTQDELLLITRLATANQPQLDTCLSKRKSLKGNFISQLIEYGRDSQAYCSDIAVMLILFRQPFKSLREQIANRHEVGQWFEDGEILMISYCVLSALQELRSMNQDYEVQVSQNSLFIDVKGNIILSDAERYKEKVSRRSGLRNMIGDKVQIMQRTNMLQLGIVISRIIKNGSKHKFSQLLIQFITTLLNGTYQCYEQALKHLNNLKKQERNQEAKREEGRIYRTNSANNQSPERHSIPSHKNTPISELVKLADSREPLRPMTCSNQLFNRIQKGKPMSKKKENKYQIYKEQFQARKAEAFAEEHITTHHEASVWLQGNTLRLDEMSSIERRTNKATQQDQNQLDKQYDNSIFTESANSAEIPQEALHPKIQLFNQSRPERLKLLILNQKGIIYEQSGDELQSLASQRTQRFRNISFLE